MSDELTRPRELYEAVTFGDSEPDIMWMPLSYLTTMHNRMNSPRKDISDFILACAEQHVDGGCTVQLTHDSVSLLVEDEDAG